MLPHYRSCLLLPLLLARTTYVLVNKASARVRSRCLKMPSLAGADSTKGERRVQSPLLLRTIRLVRPPVLNVGPKCPPPRLSGEHSEK
ncbi:hypothetical protein F4678DRAFT_186012 [Xylaria arbuscula]|nr:hypothetical protein F4678DRAFT_186012 [Xylaria arbuscula]